MCIPGLHLSLGIFNRLWNLLEDACKQLDIKLAEANLGSGTGGSTFQQYSTALQQHSSLKSQLQSRKEQVTMLEQLNTFLTLSLPDPESSALVHGVRSEATTARRIVDQMVVYIHTHTKLPSQSFFCNSLLR